MLKIKKHFLKIKKLPSSNLLSGDKQEYFFRAAQPLCTYSPMILFEVNLAILCLNNLYLIFRESCQILQKIHTLAKV